MISYNVEGQQYVVAGHLVALQALTNVLNFLKVQKIDLVKLTDIMTLDEVKEKLGEIVDECVGKARELQVKSGFITLERGFALVLSFFLRILFRHRAGTDHVLTRDL